MEKAEGRNRCSHCPLGEKPPIFFSLGMQSETEGMGVLLTLGTFFHTCPSDFIFSFPFSHFSSL